MIESKFLKGKNIKGNNHQFVDDKSYIEAIFPYYIKNGIYGKNKMFEGPYEKPYLIKDIEVPLDDMRPPYKKDKKRRIEKMLQNYKFMKDFCDCVVDNNISELSPKKNVYLIQLVGPDRKDKKNKTILLVHQQKSDQNNIKNSNVHPKLREVKENLDKIQRIWNDPNLPKNILAKEENHFYLENIRYLMHPSRFIFYILHIYPEIILETIELLKSGLEPDDVNSKTSNNKRKLLPHRYLSWLNYSERIDECLELIISNKETNNKL